MLCVFKCLHSLTRTWYYHLKFSIERSNKVSLFFFYWCKKADLYWKSYIYWLERVRINVFTPLFRKGPEAFFKDWESRIPKLKLGHFCVSFYLVFFFFFSDNPPLPPQLISDFIRSTVAVSVYSIQYGCHCIHIIHHHQDK